MKSPNSFFAKLILLIMYFFVLLFTYWTFYPYKPLVIESPVEVITKDVWVGEFVLVKYNFTKNTSVQPVIRKSLVDGIVFLLPNTHPINRAGGREDKVVSTLIVPSTVPCGEYYIKYVATYEMNPIRTVIVEYESETFTIHSPLCGDK